MGRDKPVLIAAASGRALAAGARRAGYVPLVVDGFGDHGKAVLNVAAAPFAAPPAGTAPTGAGEIARGVVVQTDGKIVAFSSKGLDSGEPARADRDLAVVRLLPNGDPDPAFGTNGVAITRNAGISENPRQGLVGADGKTLATGYGPGVGGSTRPYLMRFNANGTTDAAFGQRRRRHRRGRRPGARLGRGL